MLKKFLEMYFKPRSPEKSIQKDVIDVWKKEIIPEQSKESHEYQENVCDINIYERQKCIKRMHL